MQLAQHCADDMAQTARNPVPHDGRTHGLTDDQSDAWPLGVVTVPALATDMHDDVGLDRSGPRPDGRVKLC